MAKQKNITLQCKNRKGIIFSLVTNDCRYDSRVLKGAKVLVKSGYQVIIYARTSDKCPKTEIKNDLEFRRFHCFKPNKGFSELMISSLELPQEIIEQVKKNIAVVSRVNIFNKIKRLHIRVFLKLLRFLSRKIKSRLIKENIFYFEEIIETHNKAYNDGMFYAKHILFALNLLSEQFEETPDIIHAHDLYTLPAAILLAKSTGAKVIFDAHEIETERAPPLPCEKKEFISKLEEALLNKVDHMIVCGEMACEFYWKKFKKSKPTVIMNSPEIMGMIKQEKSMPPSVTSKRLFEHLGLKESDKIIIYTGNIGRELRGLDKAIAALTYLTEEVHLVILGPRHVADDKWLMEKIYQFGLSHRVHLLPPVLPHQVVDFISTCTMGICLIQDATLSYRYSMPNKLFEMAFAGLCICVSNLPEMEKFVTELGIGCATNQTDPQAIASSINHILTNLSKYKLTEEAKIRLENKYSWKTQAARLITVYETLVNSTVE